MSRALPPLYDPGDPRGHGPRARGPQRPPGSWDGRYRHGEPDPVHRYIIPPTGGLLEAGWTVGDTLAVLACVPLAVMWTWLMWAAFAPLPGTA